MTTVIPEWKSVRIGDLGKIVTGGTPSSKKPEFFGDRYPFITPTDMDDSLRYIETARFLSEEGRKNQIRKELPAGAVCFVCIGATIGKVCMTHSPSFTNQQINSVIVDDKRHDNRFVYYLLSTLKERIKGIAAGAATPIVNKSSFSNVEVSVPSRETQSRIAAILSAYDDLIENNTRRIKILEEMAQTIYREWFVKFRFPGHEKVKMTDSPLGPIPEGWEVVRLGDIAEEVRRGVSKGALEEPTPYVGLEHISRKSLALNDWDIVTELGSNKLVFEPGEILFGKIRPYFHKVSVAPFRGICSADTIVIRARDEKYTALVTACVSSEHFVAHATATSNGAKMPRANWKVLAEYKVIKPTADLLDKFSEIFDVVIAEQKNLVLRNNVLRKTRDLLLPRLISGEIDVLEMEEDKRQRSRCVNG